MRSPAPMPPADLSAQVSDADTHAGQHNKHQKPKYGLFFYILSRLRHRLRC